MGRNSVNSRRSARQPDSRIARALDLLTDGLAHPFVEEQMARAVGLSPSRFRHLFREQVGDSARNFQERQRMRRARELLATSRQTIGEVAAALGFSNPFYFTLRFKKHTGEGPRAFRRRMTGR
jgi:AraC family transcriptional regulator of arabinose operon